MAENNRFHSFMVSRFQGQKIKPWIGLRVFSVIVLWERGGQGRLSGTGRLGCVRPGQVTIAGWAFDAMTGEKSIYQFD